MDYVKHEEGVVTLEMFGSIARFKIGQMRTVIVDLKALVSIDSIRDMNGMELLTIDGHAPFYVGPGIAVPFLNAWSDYRK